MIARPTYQAVRYGLVVLLSITAGLKCLDLAMGMPYLDYFDPVFGVITSRWVSAGAASMELFLAFLLLRSAKWAGLLVLWLGGCFIIYHILLRQVQHDAPCACLGYLLSFTRLSESMMSTVAISLAAFFIIGGAYLLIYAPAANQNQSCEVS